MQKPTRIAPLTPSERQEFAEIFGAIGLLGGRRNVTHYSRTTKVGNTTPKGSKKMQTLTRGQYEAAKADLAALKVELAALKTPIRFSEEKFGLKGAELFAVREPKAAEAIAEYESNHHELRRSGLCLRDYVRSAISDTANAPLSGELASALDKLQAKYGAVTDLTQGGALLRV